MRRDSRESVSAAGRIRFLRRAAALCIAVLFAFPLLLSAAAQAENRNDSRKSDCLLATEEDIARVNAAALETKECGMHDLKAVPQQLDGIEHCAALQREITTILEDTVEASERAALEAAFANCADPSAAEKMSVRYGVAVKLTPVYELPLDDRYRATVGDGIAAMMRVNEPVVIMTASADGKLYNVTTGCCRGWVNSEDIAVCSDRTQWLAAWDVPDEARIVFYGNTKSFTRGLYDKGWNSGDITMGVSLRRAGQRSIGWRKTVTAFLPMRRADGSYTCRIVRFCGDDRISAGFMPLCEDNLGKVVNGASAGSKNSLSVRSIFACFGLELPAGAEALGLLPVPAADASKLFAEEKEALVASLPVGALLNTAEGQMIYLGMHEGKHAAAPTGENSGCAEAVDLDGVLSDGRTLTLTLEKVICPWRCVSDGENDPLGAKLWYHDSALFCLEKRLMRLDGNGGFAPDQTVCCKEALDTLWMALNGTAKDRGQATAWALERGILKEDQLDGVLMRESLALMLYSFFDETDKETSGSGLFKDGGSISDRAKPAVAWAVRSFLMQERSDGCFAPDTAVTRAGLAAAVRKACLLMDNRKYTLVNTVEVDGRQGIACDEDHIWVSGSSSLIKYDRNWNALAANADALAGDFDARVNHIGDIDVYGNRVYCVVEYFHNDEADAIYVAVYDGDTLELLYSREVPSESGMTEASGVAVDPENGILWICSWAQEESGRYLYRFSLDDLDYLGRVGITNAPGRLQGIAWHRGMLYLSADDGADGGGYDSIYSALITASGDGLTLAQEKLMNDIPHLGELEGLAIDEKDGRLLVLCNSIEPRELSGNKTEKERHEVSIYSIL